MILDTILVLVIALAIGIGTAWYMIDEGSALTTGKVGAWSVWYAAGDPKADPYTRAHMARSGRLPITSTSATYYFATTDDIGRELKSDCIYLIEGRPFDAAWWSLTVYDAAGRLIANKARRHSFSGEELIWGTNGRYSIRMASTVQPGNWLPSGDDKDLELVMRVYRPRGANDPSGVGSDNEDRLPSITRESCK